MHFSLRKTRGEAASLIISVSKKISKKAVTRNLIKRRVRAAARNLGVEGKGFLLIARAGAEGIKGKELEAELKLLFKL